jgi:hypothetical protein
LFAEKVWGRSLMTHGFAVGMLIAVGVGIVVGPSEDVLPIAVEGTIQVVLLYWYFFKYNRVVAYYEKLTRRALGV